MAIDREPLVLDCVIFDLQRAGGISRYWENLVVGLAQQKTANHLHLSIDRHTENPFGKRLLNRVGNATCVTVHQRKENLLTRYLPPRLPELPTSSGLFHSSYYRTHSRMRANVVTVHDFTYEKYVGGLPAKVHTWQKSRAITHCGQIICVSEATRRDLFARHPELDPARTHVIHHGIEDVFRTHGTTRLSSNPYVIFVGDRAEYKNFRNVGRAVALLPDFRLVAVGRPFSTEEHAWLNSVIPGRFEVRMVDSDEDLAALYREAHALAYPSSHEGFGMPVIEAMACGCPVVALNASSIPEIAGNAAVLLSSASVELISAALDQLRKPAYREEIIAAGYRQARRFTWASSVERHLEVYELALSKPA